MQDTAQIKQSRSSNVMRKMLKTDLISLNRCLGLLSLLSTARWWSSRFEPQEAHELTNHQKAPWHRGHAKPRQTVYLFIFSQKQPGHTVLTFHDSFVQPLNACLWKWPTTLRLQNKQARKSPRSSLPTITESLEHSERSESQFTRGKRLAVARH